MNKTISLFLLFNHSAESVVSPSVVSSSVASNSAVSPSVVSPSVASNLAVSLSVVSLPLLSESSFLSPLWSSF